MSVTIEKLANGFLITVNPAYGPEDDYVYKPSVRYAVGDVADVALQLQKIFSDSE